MKYSEVERLQEDGLITAEQRQRIIEHYGLKEDTSRFLKIISMIGAVLVVAGIVLLISANWEQIPRGIKLLAGISLLLGAHGAGYYLREIRKQYDKTGEALHLVGSLLFLGNIALVGQIYHLSSRMPNAFLLWFLGIAALPWLLRSKAQHLLCLLSFGLWFGLELNENTSWIYLGREQYQIVFYAMLGLIYLGFGYSLRRTSYVEFSQPTEDFGLLLFHGFLFPLTWKVFYDQADIPTLSGVLFLILAVLAVAGIFWGLREDQDLTRQWRLTWGGALMAGIGLLGGALLLAPHQLANQWWNREVDLFGYYAFAALVWFVICLLQIQAGIQRQSRFMVNLGVAGIALNIFATYLNLFGSMARTGLMFLISGIFLIGFGVYLEKKRRGFLKQMATTATLNN